MPLKLSYHESNHAFNDMNYSESKVKVFRCDEQLKYVVNMNDFGS